MLQAQTDHLGYQMALYIFVEISLCYGDFEDAGNLQDNKHEGYLGLSADYTFGGQY